MCNRACFSINSEEFAKQCKKKKNPAMWNSLMKFSLQNIYSSFEESILTYSEFSVICP